MTDLDTLADALGGRPKPGGGYMAPCPAHEDDTPSLSIDQGDNGKILLHCFAGCTQEDVIESLKSRGIWKNDTGESVTNQDSLEQQRYSKSRRQGRQDAAAAVAKKIWTASTPARDDHPYLARKKVKAVDTIREISLDRLVELIGYHPQSNGEKMSGDRILVIPVKVEDQLSTCEFIDENGLKSALAGGRKSGGFWAAQPLPAGDGQGQCLLVGEGVATVLSAREATGDPAVAVLTCGNFMPVARMLRERYPTADLVILGDLGNGQAKAEEAAGAVAGNLTLPAFEAEHTEWATDFNDMAVLYGMAAVKDCINGENHQKNQDTDRQVPSEQEVNEAIQRLAALSPVQYDLVRKEQADALGIRQSTLDRAVKEARKGEDVDGLPFIEVDPWPEPVDPAQLLSDIAAVVRRFIVCGRETALTVALWAAMTWFIDVVQVAPLAVITAPEKRCGKSQLLSLLGKLCARAIVASNISPSAVFRTIDAWKPTLLIDEADTFFKDNEELRGIINSGHTRDLAYVIRNVGDNFTPTKFSTWGAKAIAGIGRVADTLMDRAVVLELRRKLPHEQVERIRHAEPALFDDLQAKLARFGDDYREQVRRAKPELPPSLNDRAQDNWEPLLAIAMVAGEDWLQIATKAALKLSGGESLTETIGSELLADVQEIFESRRVDRISTVDLIKTLCEDDEKPWSTYNRGQQIRPRQIANQLKKYGVVSKTIRFRSGGTAKGYERSQFEEAFSRYIVSPSESVTRSHLSNDGQFPVTDSASRDGNVTDGKIINYAKSLDSDVVTDIASGMTDKIVEEEL